MRKTAQFWTGLGLVAVSIPMINALLSGTAQGAAVFGGVPVPIGVVGAGAGVLGLAMVLGSFFERSTPAKPERTENGDRFVNFAIYATLALLVLGGATLVVLVVLEFILGW